TEAADCLRTLRKEYIDTLQPVEQTYIADGLFYEARAHVTQGDAQKGLEVLREAFEAGFRDFEYLEVDPDLDELRALSEFEPLKKEYAAKFVERAKTEMEKLLENQPEFPFDFTRLVDMNDKEVSLADFHGKVVLVVLGGTWSRQCQAEVPQLVQLKEQ